MKKQNHRTIKQSVRMIICTAWIILWTVAGHAATLQVPSQYSTVSEAAAAAEDGDIIEIEAGQYTGDGIVATLRDDNLTIRGVNGRAHLNANSLVISNRKAIFVTTGDNITIENMEFSNATVPDENGAGIRHEGGLLTVRNCYFHDNETGILTANFSTIEVVIENSEFNHNGLGRAGYTHNMYIGRVARFTLRSSYSHHAVIGHNVKTRAAENYILYNRIMDETTGNASYQIDVPNGGLTYIIGNTLHQGADADNSRLISYAAEGASNPIQELYVSGNTFVNDRYSGYGIRISGTPTAKIVSNIFDNLNGAVQGSVTEFQNNIESSDNFFQDRSNQDFHLTADSPARNAAGDPGTGSGFDLTPIYEYLHPVSVQDRSDDGSLDAGAFEYVPISSCPADFEPDGDVDEDDLNTLAAEFGQTSVTRDVTGDGDLDGEDLCAMAIDFNSSDCFP